VNKGESDICKSALVRKNPEGNSSVGYYIFNVAPCIS